MNSLDISDVARRSGVKPSALRYYEDLGLIQSDGRKGLRRQYDDSVLERLALISMGQSAGFTLQEIGGIFLGGGGFELDRQQLRDQADRMEQQVRRLRILARALRHVASCTAPHHAECPTFRKMMTKALDQTP